MMWTVLKIAAGCAWGWWFGGFVVRKAVQFGVVRGYRSGYHEGLHRGVDLVSRSLRQTIDLVVLSNEMGETVAPEQFQELFIEAVRVAVEAVDERA